MEVLPVVILISSLEETDVSIGNDEVIRCTVRVQLLVPLLDEVILDAGPVALLEPVSAHDVEDLEANGIAWRQKSVNIIAPDQVDKASISWDACSPVVEASAGRSYAHCPDRLPPLRHHQSRAGHLCPGGWACESLPFPPPRGTVAAMRRTHMRASG